MAWNIRTARLVDGSGDEGRRWLEEGDEVVGGRIGARGTIDMGERKSYDVLKKSVPPPHLLSPCNYIDLSLFFMSVVIFFLLLFIFIHYF